MESKHSSNTMSLLYQWYFEQCNGHWEHEYGIVIQTIDNPGWQVVIDLHHTDLENYEISWSLTKENDTNWYGYKIENKQFFGAGDYTKLETIVDCFLQILKES